MSFFLTCSPLEGEPEQLQPRPFEARGSCSACRQPGGQPLRRKALNWQHVQCFWVQQLRAQNPGASLARVVITMLHSSALHDRVKNQRSQCFEGSTQVSQPTKVSCVYAHILGFNISFVKLEPGAQRENLAIGPTKTGFKADTAFLNEQSLTSRRS